MKNIILEDEKYYKSKGLLQLYILNPVKSVIKMFTPNKSDFEKKIKMIQN
jgi:hypothetical protein